MMNVARCTRRLFVSTGVSDNDRSAAAAAATAAAEAAATVTRRRSIGDVFLPLPSRPLNRFR